MGEALAATRSDLVLPRDAAPDTAFLLLQIKNPKTRGRAAWHQVSRLNQPDIIQLIDAAFGDFSPSQKLWPLSAGTLRRRLNNLLHRFGLYSAGKPHFDLSSFRPGGATWMLTETESPDLVRRRGRWLSIKVMEIYLQEVEATTYLPSLSREAREFLAQMAHAFPALLQSAIFFRQSRIPTKSWYYLLCP